MLIKLSLFSRPGLALDIDVWEDVGWAGVGLTSCDADLSPAVARPPHAT